MRELAHVPTYLNTCISRDGIVMSGFQRRLSRLSIWVGYTSQKIKHETDITEFVIDMVCLHTL